MVERNKEGESQSPSLAVGQLLQERYEIRSELGQGGFATVYSAFDITIRRQVAIKVLHVDRLNKSREHKEQVVERFLREARVAARISHPAIIEIYDFGVLGDGEHPYIIMELLQGEDLEEVLEQEGPVAPQRLIPLFCGVLEALEDIHREGVVHKDLKPANIFWTQRDTGRERLEVVDFGIAHINAPGEERLTQTGTMTGTLQYLPPEYIEEQEISVGTDIYQMGLILVEALTGTPVVDESNLYRAGMAHVRRDFEIPEAIVDSPLGPIIECCLAADPEDRYESAALFGEALADVDNDALRELGRRLGSAYAESDGETEEDEVEAESEKSSTEKVFYNAIKDVDREDEPVEPVSSEPVESAPREPVESTVEREQKGPSLEEEVQKRKEGQKRASAPSAGSKTATIVEERRPSKKNRVRLVAVAVAFAVVFLSAGVVVVMVAQKMGEDEGRAPDDAVAESVEQEERVAEAKEDASDSSKVESASSGDDSEHEEEETDSHIPSEEEQITTLISDPPGAEVVADGGELLGTTPLDLRIDAGELLHVELIYSGYQPAEVVVDEGSDEEMKVALKTDSSAESGSSSPSVADEPPSFERRETTASPSETSSADGDEDAPSDDEEESEPALQLAQ